MKGLAKYSLANYIDRLFVFVQEVGHGPGLRLRERLRPRIKFIARIGDAVLLPVDVIVSAWIRAKANWSFALLAGLEPFQSIVRNRIFDSKSVNWKLGYNKIKT